MTHGCKICSGPTEKTCPYEDDLSLDFCVEHYIEHLEDAHPGNLQARGEAADLRLELKQSEAVLLERLHI